jgi:hypothetical protein
LQSVFFEGRLVLLGNDNLHNPIKLMTRPIFNLKSVWLILSCGIALTMVRAQADNWTTTDGKVYQGVMVVKVEDDSVTILYKDGGALVSLDKLPPDLQKKFHYDPVKAKTAAQARAKRDAQDTAALEAEKDQSEQLQQQKLIDDAKAQQKAQAAVQQPQPPAPAPAGH